MGPKKAVVKLAFCRYTYARWTSEPAVMFACPEVEMN